MAAPVLSTKDQTHTLGNKARKQTVKTVLCTPYINRWPAIKKAIAEDIYAEITRVFTELKLGQAEEHQQVHKHRGSKAERRKLLEEYMKSVPEELKNLRSQLVIGVKAVTRLLEKGLLRLVVVNADSDPLLHRHLIQLSAVRGVPALALLDLAKRIGPLISVTSSLVAFGIKLRSAEDCEKLDPLVTFVTNCAPTISLDWLPNDEDMKVDNSELEQINSAGVDSGLSKDMIIPDDQTNPCKHENHISLELGEKPVVREDYSHLYVYKPKHVQGFTNEEDLISLSQDNDSDYIEEEDNARYSTSSNRISSLSQRHKNKREEVPLEGVIPAKSKNKSYKKANLGKLQSNQQKLKTKKKKQKK